MTGKGNAWAVPLREYASIDTSIPKTDGRPSVHPGKDKNFCTPILQDVFSWTQDTV